MSKTWNLMLLEPEFKAKMFISVLSIEIDRSW
jgi:hypothetical protein